MENQDSKPERRIRYNGTHPKTYKEKYKELKPEQYSEDIEKVIKQGRTPAGMHRSICVDEIMDFLQIQPTHKGLDCTLGYGGHSLEMLKFLSSGGHLFAIDVDPFEMPRTKKRLEDLGFGPEILTIKKLNFCDVDIIGEQAGGLNFVLADLGVSSMQIDNPERGFSFKTEGPLDLRLNPKTGKSAAALLKTLTKNELEEIFAVNSDEPYAEEIAEEINTNISYGLEITTTTQLKELISQALYKIIPKAEQLVEIKKACQRCFQALRIEVNNEFEVLDELLEKLPGILVANGRVAILSFHSGEDRRVKKSFQSFFRMGIYSEVAADPIRPTAQESNDNPRARSAKLRWAIKA